MGSARIFIVEDEAIVAADLSDRLVALGFAVAGTADTGKRALDEIPGARADLVLMDIVLKGAMDGVATARRLAQTCSIPVVYLTSHADERTVKSAIGTDPYGYVLKPFNDRELQVAIRIALHRHDTEQRLRRLERWLSTLLGSLGDGVVATDPRGCITLLNPAAQRLTGWSDDEAVGRRFDEVLQLLDARTFEPLAGIIERGREQPMELGIDVPMLLERRDGDTIPVDDSVAPIRDDDGETTGVVVVIRDATTRLEAERLRREKLAAEMASQQKTHFLSRVSHELRNPLNAILGFTELLQRDSASPLDAAQRVRVETVHAAGQHLLSLINDVLDLSRIEQGERNLQLRPVPVREALDDACGLLLVEAQRAGVALRLHPVPQSLCVAADARALKQVLVNLVSNGIKYNRRGHPLTLRVEAAAHEAAICIVDEGLGLSPQQLGQLFQPFNRLGAENSAVGGTGLGLVIARGLVEAMGGQLTASSTEGSGTEFRLVLPRAEPGVALPEAHRPIRPAAPEPPAPAATLLYIEDDPVNALLFTQALATTPQWRVVLADNGTDGLALARQLRPDLIVADVNLPGLTGLQVVEALRADPLTRNLRCIALSADAMPSQRAQGAASGFDDYWTKPVELSGLANRLSAWLPRSRS